MHMPNIAIIENDKMVFYRYTDASKSRVETATAPKDARLVARLFDALEWKPLTVSALTPAAQNALSMLP